MERTLLQFLGQNGSVSLYFALGFAFIMSMVKYVVPPVPGDITILLLSFYLSLKHQSLAPVAAGVALGGTIGAMAAYKLGTKGTNRVFFNRRFQGYQDKFRTPFKKCSFFMMLFNRFLPGIRPFVYPLAGAYNVDLTLAFVSAAIGNVLFGLFICAVVLLAGRSLEQIKAFYNVIGIWLEFTVLSILVFFFLFMYRKKLFGLIRRED